jgi:hypothetical protein
MYLKSTALIFLLACKISFSQVRKVFGINAGVNYSSLRWEGDEFGYESEVGFLTGVKFSYYVQDRLSLKVELNYERKVVARKLPISVSNGGVFLFSSEVEYRFKHDYLVLPVLMQYDFGKKNPFYVNLGPNLGYILNVDRSIDGVEGSEDITPFFNSFELGFSAGIGKTFSMDKYNVLFVEIRNNLGLTSISDGSSIKTNSLNFILGWNFNF